MRKLYHVPSITVGLVLLLLAVSPSLAATSGPSVQILGENSVRTNHGVTSTYRFAPGRLDVQPGAVITFSSTVPCQIDCDHTISIVNKGELPSGVVQTFQCLFDFPGTVCAKITDLVFPHGPGGPANPIVTVPGEPSGFKDGNTFLIRQGQTLEIVVTAPSGTTIHYMCAIHPWMQAAITVGNNDSNSDD